MSETMLIIEAREPLAFPESKPGTQFRKSLPFVPGAVLFGAIGWTLAHTGQFDPDLLRRLRCRNAYPMREGDAWVRPLPATAFHPKGDDQHMRDSLVQRVCWERQRPSALLYAPVDADGRPWEPAGQQFYTIRDGKLEKRTVTQRIHTRVAINRRRGTAEDSLLYSFFAINETIPNTTTPTRFIGSLALVDSGDPETWERVKALLRERVRRLGARQTTGIGGVTLDLAPPVQDRKVRERGGADRTVQTTDCALPATRRLIMGTRRPSGVDRQPDLRRHPAARWVAPDPRTERRYAPRPDRYRGNAPAFLHDDADCRGMAGALAAPKDNPCRGAVRQSLRL